MKWTNLCGAVLAMLGLLGPVHAGTCAPLGGHGADKGCGCAPAYQPCTSKPVICRPNHRNVCTYQRSCSKQACGSCVTDPACGTGGSGSGSCGKNTGCGASGCAPTSLWGKLFGKKCDKGCGSRCGAAADPGCAAPGKCVKPADPGCAAPNRCVKAADPACAAPAKCVTPADPGCAAPNRCVKAADPACAAPAKCAKPADPGCAAPNRCVKAADPACAAPAKCAPVADPGCGAPVRATCAPAPAKACDAGSSKVKCCKNNSAEVAHLICESQTACYAKQRAKALVKLGRLDCACNPEIMNAFAYALNDCDEHVRKEAAEQITKQSKKNGCCCTPTVVAALTCALADCDRGVRRAAEKALEACGYDVQDCKERCAPARCVAAATNCGPAAPNCGPAARSTAPATTVPAPATTVPATEDDLAPAPIPAEAEPAAYYPSRLKTQNKAKKSGLANLFGLR